MEQTFAFKLLLKEAHLYNNELHLHQTEEYLHGGKMLAIRCNANLGEKLVE